MAVNLLPPDPESLRPVAGVELGFAEAGIRKTGRRDLMLMRFSPDTRIAGVFTQNSFAAAPVKVCRKHLDASEDCRALIVNAGNANCGTGDAGMAAALRTCDLVAKSLGCLPTEVLPFSTGVILEELPVGKIEAALPRCVQSLAAANWADAASAIMTTDTVPKGASVTATVGGKLVTVTGIAKGVGMLQPNMATMLAFIATDAAVSRQALNRLVREVANVSFNCVTVDGDTSTNDSFVLAATGAAQNTEIADVNSPSYAELRQAVIQVAAVLAQAIARDGEGATKFITIRVESARDAAEAAKVAKRIANSPLVKTAFFASDPNLGRLLMAIGNAGVADFDVSKVDLYLDNVKVIEAGGRAASYREEDGARAMKAAEISMRVLLGRGASTATVWTCDFSYDYVKINTEYRT
jgi:glutamate N-acetyltransferase/amino-acid N-acetyltransferase